MSRKDFYVAPGSEVLELRLEAAVLTFSFEPQFNDPFNPEQDW